ncbi:MAG: tetratricopeptide repeat protein, partial [Bacteroidales bacterium]|nr:tetratricopeptide repeat protein [Bacteroidales bacterium]
KQASYTLGYTNYKLKNYNTSIDNMKSFVIVADKSADKRQIDDANNRIGDGFYVQKQFDNAITYYNKVINNRGLDADYAYYQKAMSYSALCKYEDKIDALNALLRNYPNSDIAPSASYEIASTYLLNDDNERALAAYQSFLASYPKSTYAKEALLKTGIIYYNTSRQNDALAALEQVVKEYPGTAESRDALEVMKNIYTADGRPQDYFDFVQTKTNVVISQSSQDSITFMAAENFYFDGENEKAAAGLESYLKRFPRGLFALSAHYYLADCLDRSGKAAQALPHYEYVAKQAKSQYTETALLRSAQISFNEKQYSESNKFFAMLAKNAESNSNIQQANLGLLRTYFLLDDYENSVKAANKVLSYEKITTQETEEATYYKARSLYNMKRYDDAIAVYRTLQSADNGEYAGEANYREAELYFNNKDFVSAENAIEEATSNPRSDYWSAKTFILWAEIFYINGNTLQAKQTLQSIIDNYDGDDLVQEAIQRRNEIIQDENAIKAQAEADSKENELDEINVDEN